MVASKLEMAMEFQVLHLGFRGRANRLGLVVILHHQTGRNWQWKFQDGGYSPELVDVDVRQFCYLVTTKIYVHFRVDT